MSRSSVRRLARALLALCAAAPAPLAAQPAAGTPRPVLYAAAWDSAVASIARTWIDTAYLATRWVPAAQAARAAAIAAPSDDAFRQALRTLIGEIPASHFYLLPAPDPSLAADDAPSAQPGRAGLRLRLAQVGGRTRLLVSHVEPGGAAARAGVRPGDDVLRLDGRDLATIASALPLPTEPGATMERARYVAGVNGLLVGAAGSTRTLEVQRGAEAAPRTLPIVLDVETRPLLQFGNLPPMPADVTSQVVPVHGGAAAVIRFDAFLPALMPRLDDALFAARACSALVLDLRGNPGGLVGMIGGIAGHLLERADTLAVLTQRTNVIRLVANPRTVARDGTATTIFRGPVLVLVDEASASASEILGSALQGLGRARIVGTRSAGMALPAHMRRLATGDVLVHAMADLTGPRGLRTEGDGLSPDVYAPLDPARLATGEDPALAAALATLRAGPALAPAGPSCRTP